MFGDVRPRSFLQRIAGQDRPFRMPGKLWLRAAQRNRVVPSRRVSPEDVARQRLSRPGSPWVGVETTAENVFSNQGH